MTARHDPTPEPSDALKSGRPDHGQADDGKTGGAMVDGKPGEAARPDGDRHAPGLQTPGAKPPG